VTIDATKLSTINIPVFNIAGLAQYDPLEAGLEAGWESKRWRLAVGLTWKHWSDYPGPLEPTLPELQVPQVGYNDTLVPRVAVEHTTPLSRTAGLHVRGGYFFEPTPIPAHLPSSQAYDIPSQSLINVPTRYYDADRHVLTAGLGVSLVRPLRLDVDAFAQLHLLAPRTMTLDAGNADGTAQSVQVSGSIAVTGIQVAVGF
jgi:long-chain fatty acid transport protein